MEDREINKIEIDIIKNPSKPILFEEPLWMKMLKKFMEKNKIAIANGELNQNSDMPKNGNILPEIGKV
jgi:hypothetical protein